MRVSPRRAIRPIRCFGSRREAGFSLAELIVVLLIIAMAGAFSAPAIQSGWRARAVRQSTRQVAGIMRALRERAVRRGVDQELVLDPDGSTLRWSGGGEETLNDSASIVGVRGGWRDDDGSVRVLFYSNGATSGGAVLIGTGEPGDLRFAIQIDPLLGSVIIEDATS